MVLLKNPPHHVTTTEINENPTESLFNVINGYYPVYVHVFRHDWNEDQSAKI